MMPEPPLERILAQIAQSGPLTVAEYMAEALYHRSGGYYAAGDPLGRLGDFITAPEVSQMFGELVGFWILSTWIADGQKHPLTLIELGPGRGTMMSDMIRAFQSTNIDLNALDIHLVETNSDLRTMQDHALKGLSPTWHDDLSTLPNQPWYLVANEFLDALPVHQIVWSRGAWRELVVIANKTGNGLAWGVEKTPSPLANHISDHPPNQTVDGLVFEMSPAVESVVTAVAYQVATQGGGALFIDYGEERQGRGSSLQAIRGQKFVDPLIDPGFADLSCHVDFSLVSEAARRHGASVHGPVSQCQFLLEMGIEQRANTLMENASEDQKVKIDEALHRLIGKEEMGTLFKVIALTSPGGITPAGFVRGIG